MSPSCSLEQNGVSLSAIFKSFSDEFATLRTRLAAELGKKERIQLKQTDILNLAVLNELQSYGRSPQFLEQLIEIYEDHAKLSIAELNLALQRGDRANLRSVAHRLKGSSLNIGATAAANLLYIIERFPATEALDPSIVELLEELQGLLSVTTKALKLLK